MPRLTRINNYGSLVVVNQPINISYEIWCNHYEMYLKRLYNINNNEQ